MKPKLTKFTKWYVKAIPFLICFAVLATTMLIRASSRLYAGKDAYFILRFANDLSLFDSLSYGGRFAAYNFGTPAIISILPQQTIKFLPILIGLLTLLLVSKILITIKLPKDVQFLSLIALSISPPFIYLFGTLNTYFLPIFLIVLGFYLFTQDKKIYLAAFLFVSSIIPFFNIGFSYVFFVILFFYMRFKKIEKKKIFLYGLLLTTFFAATQASYALTKAGPPESLSFISREEGLHFRIQTLISDLGGVFGVGIFSILLGAAGIFSEWKNKYKNRFAFFSTATLIVIAAFRTETVLFLNFFLSALAAYGIIDLVKREWESATMKQFMILILICGLIFSAISHINQLNEAQPSDGVISGLNFLKKQPAGVVFSHYSRGIWINYAHKKNVMDENFLFAPQQNERYVDSERLFRTRNEEETRELVKKYNITYVWMDERLKRELWTEDEDGLIFILKYSGKWAKIYDKKNVEIWKFSENQQVFT
ncbi:hypothetical protein HY643_04145 [Candidatus Woesearchaeota archaeon]|nr:hypothetical protein [Candidatus Woesearchaeota archaeon]